MSDVGWSAVANFANTETGQASGAVAQATAAFLAGRGVGGATVITNYYSPSILFAGGVNGTWYDPSDLTTMFTTSAGTTPVSMPGQGSPVPVGLMLDKSQGGVGTNGAKRVNLLEYSEVFNSAYWQTASNVTITANASIAPNGTTTADLMTEVASTATHRVAANGNAAISGTSSTATYKLSCYYKANAGSPFALLFFTDGGGSNQARAWFNLSTGAKGSSQVVGNSVVVSYEMTPADNGYYLCSMTCIAGSGGQAQVAAFVAMADADLSVSYAGSTGRSVLIWGADLRLTSEANTAPTYQRIDANWYSTMAGNHAIAINDSTARPELRARVNLLTYSEEFNNAAWTKSNLNPFGSGSVANTTATLDPLGGNTADYIQENSSNSTHFVEYNATTFSAGAYTILVHAKIAQRSVVAISVNTSNTNEYAVATFDLNNASVSQSAGTATIALVGTPSIVSVGNGWYRCAITISSSKTFSGPVVQVLNSASYLYDVYGRFAYAGNGTSGIYIWGADLRPANIGAAVPAYQRIADANTYDTAGFPLYLFFDGIDDSMYTPANLNLSGTDKVAVFAGVRKLNATGKIIAELSSSTANPGTFAMAGDVINANEWTFVVAGTGNLLYGTVAGFAPPVTTVLTQQMNQAGATDAARVSARGNGAPLSLAYGGSIGTPGNFGTYPLYIGSRNNSSLWFNGHLHGLIVVGSAVSAGNISATESWMANKTGIVIP